MSSVNVLKRMVENGGCQLCSYGDRSNVIDRLNIAGAACGVHCGCGNILLGPVGEEAFNDFLNKSRQERNDCYKDKSFIERGANLVQEQAAIFLRVGHAQEYIQGR